MKSGLLSRLLVLSLRLPLLILVLVTAACEKEPGEGGNSVIRGRVLVKNFPLYQQSPAIDQDVFIIYGDDDNTVDDRTRTSYDGTFKFQFLKKGRYKVFVYSQDTTPAFFGRDTAIILDAEISKNHSEVTLRDLITFNL